jgi:hypothetical protein
VYFNPTQVYVNPTQVGRLLADLAGVSNDEIVLLSETLLPDRTLEACFAVTNIVNPTVSAFPPHLDTYCSGPTRGPRRLFDGNTDQYWMTLVTSTVCASARASRILKGLHERQCFSRLRYPYLSSEIAT